MFGFSSPVIFVDGREASLLVVDCVCEHLYEYLIVGVNVCLCMRACVYVCSFACACVCRVCVARIPLCVSRQGRGIRKADGNVTLVLNWCTMPIVGVLRRQHTSKAEFTFPETWEELSAATSKRRAGA